jgi:hypothetical protein
MSHQGSPRTWRIVERDDRHAEDCTRRRTQRPRARGVGAARRQRDPGAERVCRTKQRADVPRIADVPQRKREWQRPARQVVAPVDADHARRVTERRQLGDKGGIDVLARDEQFDRLDAGGSRGLDEVLALANEEPFLLALPP